MFKIWFPIAIWRNKDVIIFTVVSVMIVMCVIIILLIGMVSFFLAPTFSIGKSRRGDEIAAAAAS